MKWEFSTQGLKFNLAGRVEIRLTSPVNPLLILFSNYMDRSRPQRYPCNRNVFQLGQLVWNSTPGFKTPKQSAPTAHIMFLPWHHFPADIKFVVPARMAGCCEILERRLCVLNANQRAMKQLLQMQKISMDISTYTNTRFKAITKEALSR